jgi:hypothetical protein
MSVRRALAVAASVALGAALAGCGLGPGSTPRGVQLAVTRDFGARVLRESGAPRVVGQETVMQLLLRNARVGTAYGGGFVQSIDGLSGKHASGRPVDWFYYVNGIQAGRGAADTRLHPGDRVWWDLHDWSAAETVPAVVGSFPEPFLHGDGGRRLPVRVDCAGASPAACRTVAGRLRADGVPAALGALGSEEPHSLSVLVGPWTAIHGDPAALALERGPRASGVYARPARDGRTLTLLDPRGAAVRTLGPGAGLVAATRYFVDEPTWVVTGTDAAGVDSAARALSPVTLHDRFAIATTGAAAIALPVESP